MEIINCTKLLVEKLEKIGNQSIGLIYVKGELHEGHLSLIRKARNENFIVVLANVVVPREFASMEAYDLCIQSTKEDEDKASLAGADFYFKPSVEDFEEGGVSFALKLNSHLAKTLNAEGRPGYYENKLITILKLLNIVKPKKFYTSDKDMQQVILIKDLLKQFHYSCTLRVVPAIRDEDKLFFSYKNQYLKKDARKQAAEVYRVLQKAQLAYSRGMISSRKLKWHIENEISKLYLCKLKWVEIVEPERLRKIETITDRALVMMALQVGEVSLNDYIPLTSQYK